MATALTKTLKFAFPLGLAFLGVWALVAAMQAG